MRKFIVIVVASSAISGCGTSSLDQSSSDSSSGSSSSCMVTSEGNQVCGQAAVAWCQATQPERSNAESSPYIEANVKTQLQQTDTDCSMMGN